MKSNTRRTRYEMVFEILTNFLESRVTVTRVMARANISPQYRNVILQNLIEKKLIRLTNNPKETKRNKCFYEVTDRGQQFLRIYSGMQGMLE